MPVEEEYEPGKWREAVPLPTYVGWRMKTLVCTTGMCAFRIIASRGDRSTRFKGKDAQERYEAHWRAEHGIESKEAGSRMSMLPDDEAYALHQDATLGVQEPPERKGRGMRLFELHRDTDETGISGTGVVAQGVEFDDGTVAMRWTTEWPTSVVFHDRGAAALEAVHGHGGKTRIVWDPPRVALDDYASAVATDEGSIVANHQLRELMDALGMSDRARTSTPREVWLQALVVVRRQSDVIRGAAGG